MSNSLETNEFVPTIGLEIHAQLSTVTKLFVGDPASESAGDNENISEVSCGFPGTLPVLNAEAVRLAVRAGLALRCNISPKSYFARKNYFYPDLPKGYQISQFDQPICLNGRVDFLHRGSRRSVGIERAHLEEDAGKSIHQGETTLLDFGRAGVPLLEIVSKPEIESAAEAADFVRAVRLLLKYADACDGNLEQGSLRCDCNVSVRPKGQQELGVRVEIKNLNSFRFIERAIEFEIQRQIDLIRSGNRVQQETRLFDADKGRTTAMRSKESAHDYRYFPDPDLPPVQVSFEQISKEQGSLPQMPLERVEKYVETLGISQVDAELLASNRSLGDYFDSVLQDSIDPNLVCSWILNELLREMSELKQEDFTQSRVSPRQLGDLVQSVSSGEISGKIGKVVFQRMWTNQISAQQAIQELGLRLVSDREQILSVVRSVLAEYPQQVMEYRAGKLKVMGFFVGAVMKKTKGQASPELVNQMLLTELAGDGKE